MLTTAHMTPAQVAGNRFRAARANRMFLAAECRAIMERQQRGITFACDEARLDQIEADLTTVMAEMAAFKVAA